MCTNSQDGLTSTCSCEEGKILGTGADAGNCFGMRDG